MTLMKVKHFLCFLFLIPVTLWASKGPEYPINEIADSLKRNAGAVVRFDNVKLDIHNIHSYSYSEEKVISILNSSHENLAGVTVGYDEQRGSIKTFRAWIYDADGKLVKHFDKQDGNDYSATPGYVLAGTGRVKYWDLKKLKAPYTIKYIYETETAGTFQLPEGIPAFMAGVSIEHAKFEVNCGEGVQVNYKAIGLSNNNTEKDKFLWEITGFNAIKKIDYGPEVSTALPHVLLMAKQFEIYGYTGTCQSWNDIGIFMNTLMKGRDVLNPADDPKLNDIINSSVNEKEKVRLMYKYLQSNFRYVCITLGIGGWQPQEASFTLQKKYGDCKALSMVMKAMLKKAGIESCLTLITAGDGPRIDLSPEFPHMYFNHAILCVPLPDDTIWLECTSPVSPFNYLGSFTSNRRGLMIYDGGARIVKTPVYAEKDNGSHSKSVIKLNTDNSVSIAAVVSKHSEFQDNLRSIIEQKDPKNIEAAVYNGAHLKNSTINAYSIINVEPDKPVVSFSLDARDEGTIRKTESRLFVKTDIFTPITYIPERTEHRSQKVYVNTGYTQTDTLVYALPTGYAPESFKAGEAKEFTDKFGYANCDITYSAETGQLQLIRKFCLKHATYGPEEYNALREFLLKTTKQCCPELVLRKPG